ncbi:MAG: amidohydrolase family protein [bacterium]
MRVVDAHLHFITKETMEKMGKERGLEERNIKERRKRLKLPEFKLFDFNTTVKKWLSEFNRYQIEKGVFLPFAPNLQEMIALPKVNDRFIGFTSVDPTQENADEILEEDLQAGLKGVKLYPVNRFFHVNDPKAEKIYPVVEKYKVPVIIHFGLNIGPGSNLLYGNPLDLHPVALKHPEVSFIIAHFGCGFAREALFLAYQCNNIYYDTSSSNVWINYLPHKTTLKGIFQRFLDTAGSSRLIFGTDSNFFPRGYRYDIFLEQKRILDELGVAKEEQENIFGGNILKLLSLKS